MPALTLTFEKLPLSQRSGTVDCVSRVCSSWAGATTRRIVLDSTDTDSLQRWLRSRGASVLEMELSHSSEMITTLPCPQLHHLELFDSSVDLHPGSQLLQDLCSATALTSLTLVEVAYKGDPDLSAVLSALPNLHDLGLINLDQEQLFKVQDSPQEQQQQPRQLHASTVSEVQDSHEPSQRLWSAHGDPRDGYRCFTNSGMEFLCKLTKLQSLELGSLQGVTAAGLAGLPKLQALECLRLVGLTCDISLSDVPTFSQLTNLSFLVLSWVWDAPHREFDPSILAHMTQLEVLSLVSCIPARGTACAAELLSRLARMPKLKGLVLTYIGGLEQCPPEAFSSLTSSSMLEELSWQMWEAWVLYWWVHFFYV